jgi:GNAT superfamily N-acetyltransferase
VLQRIPFQPLDMNVLYLLEYSGVPPEHAALRRVRAEVRRATPKDIPAMAVCQNTPMAFRNRFRTGDDCVIAIVRNQVVAFAWFCRKPVHTEERYSYPLYIPRDTVYAYDAFILPEHRRTGIWLKFIAVYLRELMCKAGRNRILIFIDYGNCLAMRTHLRFGFRIVRTIFIVKILGKSYWSSRNLPARKLLPGWVACVLPPVAAYSKLIQRCGLKNWLSVEPLLRTV